MSSPRRNPVVDPDATWGVRTTKSKTAASKNSHNTEFFFGYKAVFLADATHNVPLGFILSPANEGESPKLRDAMGKMAETYGWLRPKYLVADRGFDSQQNHRFLIERDIVPIIHIRKPTNGGDLHGGIYSKLGAPTCLGGKVMTYIKTDPHTGWHLYACPSDGCDRFRSGKRNIIVRCQDSHWEDPADNPRVIGVIPRVSDEWERLYAMRTGLERAFGSMKRSRLLDRHQYVTMPKVRAHVGMATLNYAATMYVRSAAQDFKKVRHMRIKV